MPGDMTKVAELEGLVTDLETQVTSLSKKLEVATANDTAKAAVDLQDQIDEMTKQLGDVSKSLEQATDALEDSTLEKAELEAVAKMTEKQRAYYDALDKSDKKKKPWFLNLKDEEKDEEVKKHLAGDESVVIEGETIRKSAVGDASFSMLKKQADRIAKIEADAKKDREVAETTTLQKRADDEFSHVPGSTEERGKMLGVIAKLDEPIRKAFEAVFTQSEKLAAAGFETLGHGGGKPPQNPTIQKAVQDFESKVSEIRKRDSLSRSDAMSKARKEHPTLFKAYQETGENQAN